MTDDAERSRNDRKVLSFSANLLKESSAILGFQKVAHCCDVVFQYLSETGPIPACLKSDVYSDCPLGNTLSVLLQKIVKAGVAVKRCYNDIL